MSTGGLAGQVIDFFYDMKDYINDLSVEEIKELAEEKYDELREFISDLNYEYAHDRVFVTNHYPYFLALQITITCILIKRIRGNWNWWKNMALSYAVIFLGRNIVALLFERATPLLESPSYSFNFFWIWYLINKCPGDIFYKILNLGIFDFIGQFIICLINVREASHGIDLAIRVFPSSISGALLVAFILSSMESVVWRCFLPDTRQFGAFTILFNLLWSIVYYIDITYTDLPYVIPREILKFYALYAFCGIRLLDNLFGFKKIDGLTLRFVKLFNFLPYHGGDFTKKN